MGECTEKEIANETGGRKKALREKKDLRDRSPVELLSRRLGQCSTQLRYLVDGSMGVTPGDELWLKVIKHMAPRFIVLFHRLGVDVVDICNTIVEPENKTFQKE